MSKRFPLAPCHPERICWGCDRYCAADAMRCGNGSDRTMHPIETLGADWYEVGHWDLDPAAIRHGAATLPRPGPQR